MRLGFGEMGEGKDRLRSHVGLAGDGMSCD